MKLWCNREGGEYMFMDVLIVEDNDIFLNIHRKNINRIMDTYQVGVNIASFTYVGDSLDSYIKEQNIDLAVLDIEIGQKSGLSVARKLITYHPLASIIFITSHGEFIKKANALCPVGFLDKPVDNGKFERLIYRVIMEKRGVMSLEETNTRIVSMKRNREDIELKESEILYINRVDRKLHVVLKSDAFYTNSSIISMCELLSPLFVRISRDIIVNKREVFCVEKGKITMSNKDILNIPFFKYKEIVQLIRS